MVAGQPQEAGSSGISSQKSACSHLYEYHQEASRAGLYYEPPCNKETRLMNEEDLCDQRIEEVCRNDPLEEIYFTVRPPARCAILQCHALERGPVLTLG